MLNLVLFGPPGAGKGTQSNLLIDKYNLVHLSTGDILRGEIAAGTALVGKFGGGDAAQVIMREGVDLAVSDSHSDFFAKNQLAIRLTMRLGFAMYRPTAFCSITNF